MYCVLKVSIQYISISSYTF